MEISNEMLQTVKEYLAKGETLDAVCAKLGIDKSTVSQMMENVSADDLNKAADMLSGFLKK